MVENKKNIYLLSDTKIQSSDIIHLPIFQIKFLPYNIDYSKYDALIFTSKNGIYSLNDEIWKNLPSYAISKKTAEVIKQYNGNLCFTGNNGHGDNFAYELVKYLKNKKVLYIRAYEVVSSLVDILQNNSIECDQIITYKTECKIYSHYKLFSNAKIIFTSPSTIKCFLKSFQWNDSYTAIAIGKTTASYFPTTWNYKISQERTILSTIIAAK